MAKAAYVSAPYSLEIKEAMNRYLIKNFLNKYVLVLPQGFCWDFHGCSHFLDSVNRTQREKEDTEERHHSTTLSLVKLPLYMMLLHVMTRGLTMLLPMVKCMLYTVRCLPNRSQAIGNLSNQLSQAKLVREYQYFQEPVSPTKSCDSVFRS